MEDHSQFDRIAVSSKFLAWLYVGAGVWVSLSFCWLWLAYSVWDSFRIPSAGAVLVCGGLIAEIILQTTHWTRYRTFSPMTPFRLGRTADDRLHLFTDGFKQPVTRAISGLAKLADQDDFHTSGEWRLFKTTARAHRVLSFAAGFSAVFGTILWGYGECFLSSGSTCLSEC